MKAAFLAKLTLFALFPSAFTSFCSAQANLAGDWQGTVDAGGSTFRVAWHAKTASDGTLTSTLDNIDQNIFGIKVKSTTLSGSNLTMTVDDAIDVNGQQINLKGSVEGTLNSDRTELTGTWTQTEPEQAPLPLHLARAGSQASNSAPASQVTIAGDWSGTLTAGPAQLRLLLHITAGKDGALSGTLDSIDQGANGIPINSVTLKDGKLALTVDAVHGTYEGNVNKEATEITGTWSQGQPLELNFKRAEPEAAAPKPAAPTDIDGTWTGRLETGAATLTINLKVVNTEKGLTAELQSPDQAPNWAPASSVNRDGDKFTLRFNAFDATYEGKIASDHTTIDGKFIQMGNEMPLVLKKI